MKTAMDNSANPASGRAGVIVVVALVVLVLAGFAATQAFGALADARTVHIQDADGKTYDMPLSEDGQVTVATAEGENTIVVEAGKVHVESADCPNQDCVHQGEISQAGQQIVCLPHKLVVSIEADGESTGAAYDVMGS